MREAALRRERAARLAQLRDGAEKKLVAQRVPGYEYVDERALLAMLNDGRCGKSVLSSAASDLNTATCTTPHAREALRTCGRFGFFENTALFDGASHLLTF